MGRLKKKYGEKLGVELTKAKIICAGIYDFHPLFCQKYRVPRSQSIQAFSL